MSSKSFNRNDSSVGQPQYNKKPVQGRGNFQKKDQAPGKKFNSFSKAPHQKLQPGSYSKGGKAYVGKREKLKERQNYASKVKSKFSKELSRGFQANGNDAAFATTPDFYKEIFAEVDRENFHKKSSGESVGNQPKGVSEEEDSDSTQIESDIEATTSALNASEHSSSVKRAIDQILNEEEEKQPKPDIEKSSHKKPKPNSFKKSIEELEKQQKELEKVKRDAANESARRKNEQKVKKRQRKQITSKLMRRTKNGQPILGNQISIMLSKLEKS